MHSLFDLQNYFTNNEIPVKKYNGLTLIVGNDIWTMAHGIYYRNSIQTNPKDASLLEVYRKLEPEVPTSKAMFKAIGAPNYNIEE